MSIFTLARAAVLPALFATLLMASSGPSPISAELGHFDATLTQTLTSVAPGADRGAVTTLRIPMGDHEASNNVVFDPVSVTYTPSCNIPGGRDRNNDGDALDANETTVCLNPGDVAGSQTSSIKLGLANNACNSPLAVLHDLFAVETPNNELDPRASTNIAWPRPEGATNRFLGWQIGSEPPAAGGAAVLDADANTRAEGGSLQFQNYPQYLLDVFDPDHSSTGDGPLPPVIPEAIYGGSTVVSGEWAPLYFAVFLSGQLNTAFAGTAPHPFTRFISTPASSSLGNPVQSLLGDPTAVQASPSTITDFCSDLITTNNLNPTVGGISRARAA